MRRLSRVSVVSVVTAVALVVGLISPSTAAAADATETAAEFAAGEVRDLPVLPAEPAIEEIPAWPDEDFAPMDVGPADASAAVPIELDSLAPAELDGSTLHGAEVVERSEYATTYDLGDGQRATMVGQGPLNAELPDGTWREISTDLEAADHGW